MKVGQQWRPWLTGVALVASSLVGPEASATKPHPLRVQDGVLTIDGMTAQSGLDLQISDFHYLYVYVPGSGTAVIAERPFAGAREQKSAFRGTTLTITAGTRQIQVSARNRLRGTHSAFVRFEPGSRAGMQTPAVSYGDAALLPAIWPGNEPKARGPRVRLRVKAHRPLRMGKLCRPSPHGKEVCATVREVVYQPN